jgi:hypothetical protein
MKNKQKVNSSITKYSKHAEKKGNEEAQVKAKCEKIKANCISYFNGKSENIMTLEHETL